MKSAAKTPVSAVMEGPCLIHAAAKALTQHPSVEAITIKAVEGEKQPVSVRFSQSRLHGKTDQATEQTLVKTMEQNQ